jgi:hypothetical protein
MNQNLVGSIYGRSSIKIAHFVPIGQQTWPPQAVLVSRVIFLLTEEKNFLEINHSETRTACGGHVC